MWKQWVMAVLGILIILVPNLGFPLSWIKLFIVTCGIVIAVLSFWVLSEAKNKIQIHA